MKKSKELRKSTFDDLFLKSGKIISDVEKLIKGKLFSYWISDNGSICMNDVTAIYEILETIGKNKELYLFIKSDGGNGKSSLRMVNMIRKKCEIFNVLAPLNCESAATMLALGADKIHMGPMAFLTPVDTSVRHDLSPVDKENDRVSVGTNEMERIISAWQKTKTSKDENAFKEVYKYIHPLVVAAVDRAGSLSNMLCDEIMSYHIKDSKKRQRISKILNSDYPSHGYPIVLREAQRIGIKAVDMDECVNRKLIELNEVYSEICKKQRTDFSPQHYKDVEILNAIQCVDKMIYYRLDKEWHFNESNRIWRSTNDQSAYRIKSITGNQITDEELHLR